MEKNMENKIESGILVLGTVCVLSEGQHEDYFQGFGSFNLGSG